jgi:4-hydroxy-3-methylbut-2-enyl diphosphate reductase
MKFSTVAVLGLAASSASAFGPQAAFSTRQFTTSTSTTTFMSTKETGSMSQKKGDRLKFMKNERFHRRGFKEVREQVESSIGEQFQSNIVDELKSSNYLIEKDGVKVYLAKVRCLLLIFLLLFMVWFAGEERKSSI